MNWRGVMPAITTCFDADMHVDHGFMDRHCRWLLDNGCTGVVTLGSLGEGATLAFAEKVRVLETCVAAVQGRAPVVASVSGLATAEAIELAKAAADSGCDALMVLPPYVYQGIGERPKPMWPRCSRPRRCLACFTTIRSPTEPISLPYGFRSWLPSMTTLKR